MKTQAYKTGGTIHEYKNLLLENGEPYSTTAYLDIFGDVTDVLRAMSKVYHFVSAECTVEVDGIPTDTFVTWQGGANTPVWIRLDEEEWWQSVEEDKDEKLSGSSAMISIWPNRGSRLALRNVRSD